MMRKILMLLAIASLFSMAFADGALPAIMGDFTQKTITLMNCKSPSGGPTNAEVSVDIDNPISAQMKVTYKYLDLATGTYADQPVNTYCYVPPSSTRTCKFIIPIRYGGKGNGTLAEVELLRLSGKDAEEKNPNVYSASFKFNIAHQESLQETNVFNKIKDARDLLSQGTSQLPCFGNVCCGMGGAFSNTEQAKLDIQNSEEQVKLCNITSAYTFASSAYANAKRAISSTTTNTGACQAAIQGYKGTKKVVDDASSVILGLGCEPDQGSSQSLEQAKTKLSNAATLIGKDDYEAAGLELESAKKAAASAKSSAKCASGGDQGTGGGTSTGGTGGTKPPTSSGGTGKAPPLCPLGLALAGFIGLGAYAYSKR